MSTEIKDMHPAVQFEGEVEVCTDSFHEPAPAEPAPKGTLRERLEAMGYDTGVLFTDISGAVAELERLRAEAPGRSSLGRIVEAIDRRIDGEIEPDGVEFALREVADDLSMVSGLPWSERVDKAARCLAMAAHELWRECQRLEGQRERDGGDA